MFKGYAGSFKLETEDSKDPLVQLNVSQSSSKVCLKAYLRKLKVLNIK